MRKDPTPHATVPDKLSHEKSILTGPKNTTAEHEEESDPHILET